MNSARRSDARVHQRGWSLIESVMMLLLMGVMGTGLWKTLEAVGHNQRSEESRDVLQRAEDALYGMVMRDLHLPRPENAVFSQYRPNHLEGWLPEEVLGTEPPRSIRYIVDHRLVEPPGARRYNPDPMGLLPNPPLPEPPFLQPRAAANELDLCLGIIQRNLTAATRVGGDLGFGVQQVGKLHTHSEPTPEFYFARPGHTPTETQNRLGSRTTGSIEMVHRLGCIQSYARLAEQVKSANLFDILSKIADINADIKGVELQASRDFLRSHEWRLAVVATNLAFTVLRMTSNLIAMETTPVGAIVGSGNVAALGIAAVLWADLLTLSVKGAENNAKGLPGLQVDHQKAREYADQLKAQRDGHIQLANSLQNGRGQR